MQADALRPWLTTADLARTFSLKDRRATATVARRLGGVKIGGAWRVPPDAIDRLRISARAQADHDERDLLTVARIVTSDPSGNVPAVLPAGWAE